MLARTLADELDRGVLAMRFPVGDQFATALAQKVYHGVMFYGMAGGGKTACAVELAWHQ